MNRHVGLGATGLVVSLLILGFVTHIPALLAYIASFLIATVLGYSSFRLDSQDLVTTFTLAQAAPKKTDTFVDGSAQILLETELNTNGVQE